MSSNLFTNLPSTSPTELFTTLLHAGKVRIERIVSYGQASPEGFWYDQDQDEWVIVLQGAAKLNLQIAPSK
jgi:cupin 2 domain-containing protein